MLLRDALGVVVPPYRTLAVSGAALDQMASIEFRADLVVEFRDDTGERPVMSAVVEVQLRIDEAKQFSWPVYATVERSRKRCETCLIVITPDAAVAAWARRPIRVGPGMELRPLVLGPAEIPTITDLEAGLANPILAVLSALTHGNEAEQGLPVVLVALEALGALDSGDARVYFNTIFKTLAEPMGRALRKEFMLRDQVPDFELSPDAQAIWDILQRRRALKAQIEAHAAAKMLLRILGRRGIALSPEDVERISTCEKMEQLELWADRALNVETAAELFA
ncbi:MAG TPA: hypothetical protein VGB85_31430 [Nannocystis sp.]